MHVPVSQAAASVKKGITPHCILNCASILLKKRIELSHTDTAAMQLSSTDAQTVLPKPLSPVEGKLRITHLRV